MNWKSVRLPLGDSSPEARLLYGLDVREGLQRMAPASVHCVVTSPPYWGLRSYLDKSADNKPLEIGSESVLDGFIENLVLVFRGLRRVLRTDGTVWLNLGDCYAGGGRGDGTARKDSQQGKLDYVEGMGAPSQIPAGLKPKDLLGIPWRVVFALQADGWYLRSAAPWVRRNAMPESVTDRPSASIEYMFLLAHPDSGGHYFYDVHGYRNVSASDATTTRQRRASDWFFETVTDIAAGQSNTLLLNDETDPLAFVVNPKPYAGSHFAAFPPKLVEPCILLTTSAHGVCGSCGASWQRTFDSSPMEFRPSARQADKSAAGNHTRTDLYGTMTKPPEYIMTGFAPACSCKDAPLTRAVVLDPFSGSGTTGMVALRFGRDYVGLDLNDTYLPLAESRILGNAAPAASQSDGSSVLDMFGEE